MSIVLVKNAERMMTAASPLREGIELVFADGYKEVIPFAAVPEIGSFSDLVKIELPNPYELMLYCVRGEPITLPWDFVRYYNVFKEQWRRRVKNDDDTTAISSK